MAVGTKNNYFSSLCSPDRPVKEKGNKSRAENKVVCKYDVGTILNKGAKGASLGK